jgi:hypothetical protein
MPDKLTDEEIQQIVENFRKEMAELVRLVKEYADHLRKKMENPQ